MFSPVPLIAAVPLAVPACRSSAPRARASDASRPRAKSGTWVSLWRAAVSRRRGVG